LSGVATLAVLVKNIPGSTPARRRSDEVAQDAVFDDASETVRRETMGRMGESSATQASAGGKRPLRSTTVVRDLILNAARSCFAQYSFAGTTTRQIAKRAGVVENLIFKQFGSKSELFEAAVVQPFRSALDAFTHRWSSTAADLPSGEVTAREYVEALYDLLEGHGELLLAIIGDRRGERPLVPLMQELERVAAAQMESHGWVGVDIGVLARLHFGMVAFNAAFGDVLYPADSEAAPRQRIVDEMTAFMVHGTAHRPQALTRALGG
jgi:AcrR family transcriptional regulator